MYSQEQSGIPLYTLIADTLRTTLIDGGITPGSALPSESELCRTHKASRGTVRKALQQLASEGLVETFPGKGSVATRRKIECDANKVLGYFSHIVSQNNLQATGKTLRFELIKNPPAYILSKMSLKSETPLYHIVRLRFVNGEPWALEYSWFTEEIGDIIKRIDIENDSLYKGLQKQGVEFLCSKNSIEAHSLNHIEAELLELPIGSAMLSLHRIMFRSDGTPFEYAEDLFRGDRLSLSIDVNYHSDATNFKIKPITSSKEGL